MGFQIGKWKWQLSHAFIYQQSYYLIMKRLPTPPGLLGLLLVLFAAVPLLSQSSPTVSKKKLVISEENVKVLQRLSEYPDLEMLEIRCLEDLQAIPESIGILSKLRELLIDNGNGCQMNPVLPESIGNLRSLEKLVLYGAQDPRFQLEERVAPQLRKRHKFPNSMSQLKNLAFLDLGRNGLEEIPEFVKNLPKLHELRFEWNMKLTTIPSFLTTLQELRTLRLDADGLSDLPDFLNEIPKLTLITLGDNCQITQSADKKKSLQRRFPRIKFVFDDEYECPTK
jgi:Leucine-rich repeat (LRR) protein